MISDKQIHEAIQTAQTMLETAIRRMDEADQIKFYIDTCEDYADRIMILEGYDPIEPDKHN